MIDEEEFDDSSFEEDNDVIEAIENAKKKSIKKGMAPILSLSDIPDTDVVEFLPTGIGEIDFTAGGIPKGCITHLAGPTGSGKTTFIMQSTIFALSRLPEDQCLGYCDWECRAWPAMLKYFCKIYGVNLKRVKFVQPMCGEEGCEQIINWVDDPKMAIIIGDSLKAVVPKDSITKTMSQNEQQQAQSKILHRFASNLIARIRHQKKTVIFIDHLKKKQVPGAVFQINETSTGETIKFFSSARWFLAPTKWLEKTTDGEKRKIGRLVTFKVPKSTVSDMLDVKDLTFIFRRGFSTVGFLLRKAIEHGFITDDGKNLLIGNKSQVTISRKRRDIIKWLETDEGIKIWRKIVDKIYAIEMPKVYERLHSDPEVYDMEIEL